MSRGDKSHGEKSKVLNSLKFEYKLCSTELKGCFLWYPSTLLDDCTRLLIREMRQGRFVKVSVLVSSVE